MKEWCYLTEGVIVKGIGGFYYVSTEEGIIECKARGRFRRTIGKPIVGDRVALEIQQEDGTGFLLSIGPRKNSLVRPAVANLDMLFAVASAAPPVTDVLLIDKITAIAANKDMETAVVINKADLDRGDALYGIYEKAGIKVLRVSAVTGEGIEKLLELMKGKVSAFAGNSGVGKSSLLNKLDKSFGAETGEISERTKRGKHTTRHVELLPIEGGGFIADTPGFSAFESEQMDLVKAEELQYAFPEFLPYIAGCRFTGCAHVKERDCAVRKAVEDGIIPESRHLSYVKLYESVKDIKEWEIARNGAR